MRARPTLELRDLLRGYGYTVYDYPDGPHLTTDHPQDHTPFSETGWPIASKRWVGHAIDIMPPNATALSKGAIPLPDLARRIITAKDAKTHGTEWIKYINWTNEDGVCRHVSWQPDHADVSSTDKGHIHISGRSDMDTSDVVSASGWNPVKDDGMALTTEEHNQLLNVYAGAFKGGPSCGEVVTIPGGASGNGLFLKLDYLASLLRHLEDATAELKAAPPVVSAPLDPAALKAVLLDPEVLATLAKAVNDDAARRQAE